VLVDGKLYHVAEKTKIGKKTYKIKEATKKEDIQGFKCLYEGKNERS